MQRLLRLFGNISRRIRALFYNALENIYVWAAEHSRRYHAILLLAFVVLSALLWALGTNSLAEKAQTYQRWGQQFANFGVWFVGILSVIFLLINFLGPYRGIRFKLLFGHDRSVLDSIERFLTSDLCERGNCSEWFHLMHLAPGVALAGHFREPAVVWVNPRSYMNLHVAAAVLSTSYHYSCFKAPDVIWEFLRMQGGKRYTRHLLSRELRDSYRYVFCKEEDCSAVRDFLFDERDEPFVHAANGGFKVFALDNSDAAGKVHDFSAFSVDTGWIIIRMSRADEERVKRKFEQFGQYSDLPEAQRRLLKTRFRAEIHFINGVVRDPFPPDDLIKSELEVLRKAGGRLIIPQNPRAA